jgi:hypothetical protein
MAGTPIGIFIVAAALTRFVFLYFSASVWAGKLVFFVPQHIAHLLWQALLVPCLFCPVLWLLKDPFARRTATILGLPALGWLLWLVAFLRSGLFEPTRLTYLAGLTVFVTWLLAATVGLLAAEVASARMSLRPSRA